MRETLRFPPQSREGVIEVATISNLKGRESEGVSIQHIQSVSSRVSNIESQVELELDIVSTRLGSITPLVKADKTQKKKKGKMEKKRNM